jgi:chloramphenicol-sensitive protein RarD
MGVFVQKGVIYGIVAYFLWGIFPIFWKLLSSVNAMEVLLHRIAWSLVFMIIILAVRNHWSWLTIIRKRPRILLTNGISAVALSLNWFTFIWAVNNGYIVEASLGYFINPLLNVALGVIFFKEKLRLWQGVAILVALIGVVYLTITYGTVPWVALTLAFSFGLYGVLRKIAPLDSLEGLSVELGILFLPAAAIILYMLLSGTADFIHAGATTTLLLIIGGAVTAIPLILFSAAVRRAPLVVIGLLQYMAPTMQFLIGVLLYNEPFNQTRLIGFCIIWLALIIYAAEGVSYWQRSLARA